MLCDAWLAWEGDQGLVTVSPPAVSKPVTPRPRTALPPLEAAAPDCRGVGNLHDPRCLAREAESRVPITVVRETGRPVTPSMAKQE